MGAAAVLKQCSQGGLPQGLRLQGAPGSLCARVDGQALVVAALRHGLAGLMTPWRKTRQCLALSLGYNAQLGGQSGRDRLLEGRVSACGP